MLDREVGCDGSVVAMWRYPVKSMQGEELSGATITERGVLGDRAYAIRDCATGFIASAKHPRKWSALFACRASFASPPQLGMPLPPVRITMPDGTTISSAQPDVNQVLSRALGRDVMLITDVPEVALREANRASADAPEAEETIRQEALGAAAPDRTFFDYAPLHVLTTATLDRFHDLYPAGHFDVRRFRPNLVVAPVPPERDFVENRWLGRMLRFGTDIRVRMIDPSPRCVVTTLAHRDLPRDPGILRIIAQFNAAPSATLAPGVVLPAVAGAYASVVESGTVRRGDAVYIQ